MTIQNPATWIQGATHPAEGLRRMLDSLIGGAAGVIHSSNMAVTQRASGGANMSVDIAGGRAFIRGTEATYQGIYHVENRLVANVVVTAAHSTHPRIDLVSAVVKDAAYSGATDAWSLVVTAGTAAASPVTPTAPANSISLATVTLPALATTVIDSYIADVRVTQGMSRWLAGTPDIAWSPSFDAGITEGNGTWSDSFYQKVGDLVTAQASFTLGSTSSVASSFNLDLPVTAVSNTAVYGNGRLYDLSATTYYAAMVTPSSLATKVSINYANAASTALVRGNITSTVPFTWATGDRIDISLTYLAG